MRTQAFKVGDRVRRRIARGGERPFGTVVGFHDVGERAFVDVRFDDEGRPWPIDVEQLERAPDGPSTCPACEGTGQAFDATCVRCGGSRIIDEEL